MNTNILNIDEGKTVALVLASRSYKTKHTIAGIKIGDIIPSPSAKNIDAVFDAEMSTVCHVQYIVIGGIRPGGE